MVLGFLKRTRFDYQKEVGTGIDSSVVTAPVQWIQRAFPEGRVRVMRGQGDDQVEVENHALTQLINTPNPFYGDAALSAATVFSYCTAGNGYWMKVRNGADKVVELWYAPHWTLSPVWPADGSAFITKYKYEPGGGMEPLFFDPEDIVHFRHGIDPRNQRLGLSPLHGALREIFMDLEASNFVASLLNNTGVPGVVISPDGGAMAGPDDVDAVKKWFGDAFGGDRRGDPLVMGSPTKVQQYGFNPQQMDLSVARDVAEERVCAALGVPAAVVGFGAGLQTAKVGATMSELRKLAWTNGVIPIMRTFADELQRSFPELLKPGETVEYDTGGVLALEEDRLTKAQSWDTMIKGGWAMVAEGREAMGLDVDDSHKVFLRPFSAIEVPSGGAPPPDREAEHEIERRHLDVPALASAKQDRGRSSAAQRAFVEALDRSGPQLSGVVEQALMRFFGDLGKAAEDAARPLIAADAQLRTASTENGNEKADPLSGEDRVLAGQILEQLELPLHADAFKKIYEAHYLEVAKAVSEAGELVGLATDLPDPVARAVVAAGGRRSGLVDLGKQSRAALFDSLAEGRAAGEGVDQLVKRIRDSVAAGPWQSATTRARTIARTETKYAQNTSTIARARHEGVARFIVFDGRLGPDRSDPDHIARDGSIVDAQTAEAWVGNEHPNGTISVSPYFEENET